MSARSAHIVTVLILALLALATLPSPAPGHALPTRFDPRPDAVLPAAPVDVRILFDGDLEPAFSGIQVTDAAGRRVDRREARVDPRNRRLLRVALDAMGPGVYRVAWKVLAIDGHRAQGTYVFTVAPR